MIRKSYYREPERHPQFDKPPYVASLGTGKIINSHLQPGVPLKYQGQLRGSQQGILNFDVPVGGPHKQSRGHKKKRRERGASSPVTGWEELLRELC